MASSEVLVSSCMPGLFFILVFFWRGDFYFCILSYTLQVLCIYIIGFCFVLNRTPKYSKEGVSAYLLLVPSLVFYVCFFCPILKHLFFALSLYFKAVPIEVKELSLSLI